VDKTFVVKGKPESDWLLVDALDQPVGRLATKISGLLLGKHKTNFTPGVLVGDHVVVINAKEMKIAPKRLETKTYYHHSGYPSGLKSVGMAEQMRTHPDRVIRSAVWGMIPHNKAGKEIIKRLYIYAGNDHPHTGQNPKPVK
jgi:large subunit ribosomal protein L13